MEVYVVESRTSDSEWTPDFSLPYTERSHAETEMRKHANRHKRIARLARVEPRLQYRVAVWARVEGQL